MQINLYLKRSWHWKLQLKTPRQWVTRITACLIWDSTNLEQNDDDINLCLQKIEALEGALEDTKAVSLRNKHASCQWQSISDHSFLDSFILSFAGLERTSKAHWTAENLNMGKHNYTQMYIKWYIFQCDIKPESNHGMPLFHLEPLQVVGTKIVEHWYKTTNQTAMLEVSFSTLPVNCWTFTSDMKNL